jgi:DNA-binding FrmR family transcriptional regulator
MNGESREVRDLLDRLRAVSDAIEGLEATLYQLKLDRLTLRAQLRATGWRPDVQRQQDLLP